MKMHKIAGCLSVLLATQLVAEDSLKMNTVQRQTDFVRANVIATQAYQVSLYRKLGKGDATCWAGDGASDAELQRLVEHQHALLAELPAAVQAWVEGRPGTFDPARDLQPLCAASLSVSATNLPVNVLREFFAAQPGVTLLQTQALSSLLQMMLDVDRDADLLQRLFAHYARLGLPLHTAQLGLPARTDDEFLNVAQQIAPRFGKAPFDTDAVTLRMMFRKMWNWGHRYSGERDKQVLARELLAEPDVAALVPPLTALPAQKIAVIGHSFTMNMHWSSPSACVPVAAEILKQVNPRIEVRQWEAGGMHAARADCQAFYQEVLAWKPARVLLFVANRTEKDTAALESMLAGFAAQGVEVMMFDAVYGDIKPGNRGYWPEETLRAMVPRSTLKLISSGPLLRASPEKEQFLALDGIHMTEPYHRLLAKAWLRYLCTTVK